MTTTINKKFELKEPIQKVWSYLADPTKIVTCVPGASLTEKVDDRNFKGQVAMKLGPVKVKFNGAVEIVELDEVNQKMQLKGKGIDAKGKGSADMKMEGVLNPIEAGTAVDFTMQISIIGKLAQFGARLIDEVTDQVLNQFINNFKAKLAEDTSFMAASNPTATTEAIVDTAPTPIPKSEAKEATTEEKAKALSESAEAVQKALKDVQAAQAALDENLTASLTTAGAIATNGVEKPSIELPKEEIPKIVNTKDATDNSIDGFSLMWMVIKGWFSKLFKGK